MRLFTCPKIPPIMINIFKRAVTLKTNKLWFSFWHLEVWWHVRSWLAQTVQKYICLYISSLIYSHSLAKFTNFHYSMILIVFFLWISYDAKASLSQSICGSDERHLPLIIKGGGGGWEKGKIIKWRWWIG